MSKPFTNPFFEADMSKMFDMSKFDMTKMMDMSKMMGDYKMPMIDPEALMALQRKNMEAFSAMAQSIGETMQALWRRQTDNYRQSMEEISQMAQAIMASPTPEAKAMKQAEVGKAAFDKYIANLRDTSETLAKCNSQTMEAVGARMNENMNDLCGMVKNVAQRAA